MQRIATVLGVTIVLVMALTGCSSAASAPASPAPAWNGTFGPRPVEPACRGSADDPRPGDVICYRDDLDAPLEITVGGTPGAPITYSGTGETTVPGIRAEADRIIIQGFVSDGAEDTGIWAAGQNVTIQDNTITQVHYTQNDLDAIRFLGDGARVLHNYACDSRNESTSVGRTSTACSRSRLPPGQLERGDPGKPVRGDPGPVPDGRGPHGHPGRVCRNWLFEGNYCGAYAAAQSVSVQNVQDVTITAT